MKKGDIDILDNTEHVIENISDRYGDYAMAQVRITINTKNDFSCIKVLLLLHLTDSFYFPRLIHLSIT